MDIVKKLEQKLRDGLVQQQIELDLDKQRQLIEYISLLHKWNKTHNLTSVRDMEEMVTLHLLDSLAVLPFFRQEQKPLKVLDVGAGAGLPGIPLAVSMPESEFDLIDSRQKKAQFMQTVAARLKLKNLSVIHGRVETLQSGLMYDIVVTRAFSSIRNLLELAAHLCRPDGKFLFMKGQFPQQEIAELPEGFTISRVSPLKVSGLDAERHLVEVIKDKTKS